MLDDPGHSPAFKSIGISVIIPTLNRPKPVQDVLRDLDVQTLRPIEIFVIDQSIDAQEKVETSGNGVPIYWLALSPPNASRARNIAAQRAQAEWLLFLDDDVKFEPTLLEEYAKVVDDRYVDACTGGVLGPKDHWSDHPEPEKDAKLLPAWKRLSSYRTTRQTMRVEGACSANLLVRRQALFRSGGFDERYWGVCEDTDLGFRLAQQSYNVWHDPRPAVDHLMLKGGGSRPSAKDWTEQHLALILPIKFKLHLLLLTEHFGWLTSARFLLIRLFQYLRPSRLYLQQPLLPFIVSKLVATAFYESMKLNKRGQQLPLISGKIQGYYHD